MQTNCHLAPPLPLCACVLCTSMHACMCVYMCVYVGACVCETGFKKNWLPCTTMNVYLFRNTGFNYFYISGRNLGACMQFGIILQYFESICVQPSC